MFNLQVNKAVVGSANTQIYEDPVVGSNGTAVLMRYNHLIDDLEQALQSVIPITRGGLITLDINSNPYEINKGLESYCLVVDNGTSSGLSYRERVDLTSNQSIGGLKTFTGITTLASGFVSNATSSINGGLTITSTLSAGATIINGNINVKGSSLLETSVTVGGLLTTSSLQVTNVSTLNGGFTSNANSLISGDLIIDNNLIVDQSITSNSLITTSISIPSVFSSSSSGTTVIGNFTSTSITTGNLSASTTTITGLASISNSLSVTGKTTTGSLEVDSNALLEGVLSVNGNSNTKGITNIGNITNTGNVNITGQLIVSGSTTLQAITGTSISGTNLNISATGFISSIDSDSLESNSISTNTLTATGNSNLEDIEASNINCQSITSLASYIGVASGTSLSLSGNLSTNSLSASITNLASLTVTGISNLNQLNITSNLSVIGNGVINDLEIKGDCLVKGSQVIEDGLLVIGSIQGSNVSGTNTGDEGEATPIELGVVRVDINEVNPLVYTKTTVDSTFIRVDNKGQIDGVAPLNSSSKVPFIHLPYIVSRYTTTFNESNRVSNKVLIEHLLNTRTPASITIWNDQYEVMSLPIRSTTLDHIEIDISVIINGDWTIKILN
jgi:hypothetical protein